MGITNALEKIHRKQPNPDDKELKLKAVPWGVVASSRETIRKLAFPLLGIEETSGGKFIRQRIVRELPPRIASSLGVEQYSRM